MYDAVVYIGHGSRKHEGNEQFIHFIKSVIKEVSIKKQEYAFLELVAPSIQQTMEKIILEGAQNVLVVPVLLFAAGHYKLDIPEELGIISNRYPHVNFTTTEPFGVHENMIQLVQKRVKNVQGKSDIAILLVGRGSSDPEPIQKLKEIGQSVNRLVNVPVYTAFLTVGEPRLEDAINYLDGKYQHIYVMPYLLFTGLLLERIKRRIKDYNNFYLCDTLKFDNLMSQTLLDRINEKINK